MGPVRMCENGSVVSTMRNNYYWSGMEWEERIAAISTATVVLVITYLFMITEDT